MVDQTARMLRLGTIVMGAAEVERGVAFWSAALGYRVHRFPDSDNDFTILVPPDGEGTRVALQRADGEADPHPRLHVDLVVDSAAEQSAEVERLLELGATQVDWDSYPDNPDFVVLADPEGNAFCIVNAGHG